MRRFIDNELIKWKESYRRKPLLIRGARQVGKTWSVELLGKNSFENLITVDLEYNTDLHFVFKDSLDPSKICREIELFYNQKIIPGKTLLFIDEIQACPIAITALRYFYEKMPQLHVIAAGSLIEFALQNISFPVGRVQMLEVYPLGFIEFLYATGNERLAEHISEIQPGEISGAVHNLLLEKLKTYFFTGGMPECVKVFKQSNSFKDVFEVQRDICESYIMDFNKYAPHADKQCLKDVFTAVGRKTGSQIKYSKLTDNFTVPTIKKAFNLLCLAKVIKKVCSADPSGIPFGASASQKVFKALFFDIGLMQYLSEYSSDQEYRKNDLLAMHRGALAEQYVGQELLLAGNSGNIYYWSRSTKSSSAEVDYLFTSRGRVIPVEVKSGPSGRLKSMHAFLKRYSNSPKGYVFSQKNYHKLKKDKIEFIPLYYAYQAFGGSGTLG